MPYTLHYILGNLEQKSKKDRDGGATLRQIIVNELVAAGRFWTIKFLPIHFETRAVQRYRYPPRTQAWQKYKRLLARIGRFEWPRGSGNWHQAESPPKPNVLTGELRRSALTRTTRVRVSKPKGSTRGTFTVIVKVPTPRATNPKHLGEIVRLSGPEIRILHKRIIKGIAPNLVGVVYGGDLTPVGAAKAGIQVRGQRAAKRGQRRISRAVQQTESARKARVSAALLRRGG